MLKGGLDPPLNLRYQRDTDLILISRDTTKTITIPNAEPIGKIKTVNSLRTVVLKILRI